MRMGPLSMSTDHGAKTGTALKPALTVHSSPGSANGQRTTDNGHSTMDKWTETLLEALWLAEIQGELRALGQRLTDEVQRWTHRLEALAQQAEEALRRAEAAAGPPDGSGVVPWGPDALGYLDRRRDGGAAGDCPLPELF